ncbi:MAG: hypothetical protein COB53_09520 [Elusimicrobia bacterium]|nr:MAG: hypothetical protein COB53_09520 [Elusimicrobiota bacterium]
MNFALFPLAILLVPALAGASEWRTGGLAGIEVRGFTQAAAFAGQHQGSAVSGFFEPEISFGQDRWSLIFRPYLRIDQQDSERTHFDIREAYWETALDRWELRIGIRKVYWGVTESLHLVDFINQIDAVENIDGEDRLGQPMVNLALVREYGTLDLFALPGFRERIFPGEDGRLRPGPSISEDDRILQSGNGRAHTDWAARYSHSLGDWDIGVSHFYGLTRDPRFIARNGALVPVYELIHQSSIDLQWTVGGFLWKFEAIDRTGQQDRFKALVAGYEYTFNGLIGVADLGVLSEYQWDQRGKSGSSPADNDVFLGARLAANDEASSELLAGMVQDLDHETRFFNIEASRRIGENFKATLEGRFFSAVRSGDPTSTFSQDDYVEFGITRYF